jgi:PAS domain S-box-containing protein
MTRKPSYEDLKLQIEESDNRYRNLLNTSLVGIYQTSITGDIFYVNEALATIFEFESPEEMLMESSIVRYKYAEDREVLIQTLMELGSLKNFEFEALTKSGETKNVLLSAVLENDTISGMIMDITRRKKAEKSLKESEERYRSLFKNNHSVMLLVDPESADIVDANPAAVSFYGWSFEALTGKKITDINTLSDEQVFQEMGKAKSEQRRVFYFQHRLANGEIRDVEVFSGPIKVNDRELLYSIIHDISNRKQAEEALIKSEEKYHRLYKLVRLMADNIPDLIWAKDMDGRYMFVNQAMCDKLIMCDSPDKAVGTTDMFIAEEERNAGYENTFGELCVNSDAIIQERKVPCRILEEGFVRNKYLVLDVQKAPFLDENKEMIGTVGCGRDVTNEKKVEKALKEREIELERKNLRLKELNSALKVLLEKRDGDKKALEEKVLMNIKNLIIPYIAKLKKATLNDRQEVFVEIIQSNIEDILSPFSHKLSYRYLNFTPTELQVAGLVKQGLRTKEIADLLNTSPETVAGHRKSMRKKLNLKDKKSNLRTHLLALDNG